MLHGTHLLGSRCAPECVNCFARWDAGQPVFPDAGKLSESRYG